MKRIKPHKVKKRDFGRWEILLPFWRKQVAGGVVTTLVWGRKLLCAAGPQGHMEPAGGRHCTGEARCRREDKSTGSKSIFSEELFVPAIWFLYTECSARHLLPGNTPDVYPLKKQNVTGSRSSNKRYDREWGWGKGIMFVLGRWQGWSEGRWTPCKIMKSTSIIKESKYVSKIDKARESSISVRNMEVSCQNKQLKEKRGCL